MKTYEETLKNVLARRDEYNVAAAKKQKTVKKAALGTIICVVTAAVSLSVILGSSVNRENKKVDAYIADTVAPAEDSSEPVTDTASADETTDTPDPEKTEGASASTTPNDPETSILVSNIDPKTQKAPETAPKAETNHSRPQKPQTDHGTGPSVPHGSADDPWEATPSDDPTPDTETAQDQAPDTDPVDDPKPFTFTIPAASGDLNSRSDVRITAWKKDGSFMSLSSLSLVDYDTHLFRCSEHPNTFFHTVPKYLVAKNSTRSQSWISTASCSYEDLRGGLCPESYNIAAFVKYVDFSSAELTEWYYLKGGYYPYYGMLEYLLAGDEAGLSAYCAGSDGSSKVLAEEEMKKALLLNLKNSKRDKDKQAYNAYTGGKNANCCSFSIAGLICDTDFTVKDIESFISQYKQKNGGKRKFFDYDLSRIDEERGTVGGRKISSMYPVQADELLRSGN